MRIREYTDADWPSVWAIFREVVAADETSVYDPEWSSEQARDVWVKAAPAIRSWPATGRACWARRTWGPDRPGRGSHVATAGFMVAGEARGRGVGRAPGEHAVSWACEQGYAAMRFDAVVGSNRAAVRLWQALGFDVIGTVPEAFDRPTLGRVGPHVMHRRL